MSASCAMKATRPTPFMRFLSGSGLIQGSGTSLDQDSLTIRFIEYEDPPVNATERVDCRCVCDRMRSSATIRDHVRTAREVQIGAYFCMEFDGRIGIAT